MCLNDVSNGALSPPTQPAAARGDSPASSSGDTTRPMAFVELFDRYAALPQEQQHAFIKLAYEKHMENCQISLSTGLLF